MKNNKWAWAVAATFLAGTVAAQSNSIGSESAVELRIPTDIRSAAMGGAAVALQDGADDLTTNPAGLGLLKGADIDFTQSFWITNISLEHLVFGADLGPVGIALGGNYLNYGSIGLFTVGGAPNGSVTPETLDFSGGIGLSLSNGFYLGAAGRWLGENLIGTSWNSTFIGNFGILYASNMGLSAGVALLNAGPGLYGTNAPTQISGGAAYRLAFGGPSDGSLGAETHVFTLSMEGDEFPYSQETTFSVGGEYLYNKTLAVRAGYRFAPYGNVTEIEGLSIGGGLKLSQFELSYALITMGDLGTSNQIALAMHL